MQASIQTTDRQQATRTGSSRLILLLCAACLIIASNPFVAVASEKPKTKSSKKMSAKKTSADITREMMGITKELISETEAAELEKQFKAANKKRIKNRTQIFLYGKTDPAARKMIAIWARWKVLSLSIAANRSKLHTLLRGDEELLDYINNRAARAVKNPAAARQFRTLICQEVTKQAEKLLDNNFYVRMNAILLLSEMTIVRRKSAREPAISYTPPAEILLTKIIQSKQPQPQAIQLVAINGLKRMMFLGKPEIALRRKVAAALIPMLHDPKNHPWVRARIAQTLAAIGANPNADTDTNKDKAIIAQALAKTIANVNVPIEVRCEAAKAIGRIDFPSNINAEIIVFEITKLLHQLAKQYNKDCGNNNLTTADLDHWKADAHHIFQAFFCPKRSAEKTLFKNRPIGLLNHFPKNKPVKVTQVKEAYGIMKPVFAHLLAQPFLKEEITQVPVMVKKTVDGKTTLVPVMVKKIVDGKTEEIIKTRPEKTLVPEYQPIDEAKIKAIATWQIKNPPKTKSIQPGLPNIVAN